MTNLSPSGQHGLEIDPPKITGRCRDCGMQYVKVLCPRTGVDIRLSGPVSIYSELGASIRLDLPVYVEHKCSQPPKPLPL